jgi:hypothetical protein
MIIYYDDQSGRITRATSDNQPLQPHPRLKIPGTIDPGAYYVALPPVKLTARPRINLPAPQVGLGHDWSVDDVPVGTEVRLDGTLIGVTDAPGPLSILLPAPATYTISLTPPWPWLAAETTVTVNAL